MVAPEQRDESNRKSPLRGVSETLHNLHQEYFPNRVYRNIEGSKKDFISDKLIKQGVIDCKLRPLSDYYLKFVVTELKPYIDENFSTYPEAKYTFMGGSSMGALLSLYAVCEYPDVFGGAACLSTHWTGIYQVEDNPIPEAMFSYMNYFLANPKNHRIYFDYGDETLDSLYLTLQPKADSVMKEKGYTKRNWLTKYFPCQDHSEKVWGERVHYALEFLMQK